MAKRRRVMTAAVAAVILAATLASCGRHVRVVHQPTAITGALVSGREVIVPANGSASLTARQTTATVTVTLTEIIVTGGAGAPPAAIPGTTATTLRAPLDGRALIDGTSKRPISYLDARTLARVTSLPPGYRFSRYWPPGRTSGSTILWEREYTSPARRYGQLDIEQTPAGTDPGPYWAGTRSWRATVGKHPAIARTLTSGGQPLGRAITWSADGDALAVSSHAGPAGQPPLPFTQLTRVAAGLAA